MTACPAGHDSASGNFCHVCGQRIGGSPRARATGRHRGPAPDAANGSEPCPGCGAPVSGAFCEACGFGLSARRPYVTSVRPGELSSSESSPPGPPEWLFPPISEPQVPPWSRIEPVSPVRPEPSRIPVPVQAPPAPVVRREPPPAVFSSAPSAPPTAPTPSFTPATWTVLVSADLGYYERMREGHSRSSTDVAFPAQTSERRIPLTGHQMRIGRRSAARELEPEIDLAEPPLDPGISRLHAMLIAAPDGTWSVLDPGSANGTLLNGREIAIGDLIALRDGDRINLGAWTVISVHRG
jgi:hypothetical protein